MSGNGNGNIQNLSMQFGVGLLWNGELKMKMKMMGHGCYCYYYNHCGRPASPCVKNCLIVYPTNISLGISLWLQPSYFIITLLDFRKYLFNFTIEILNYITNYTFKILILRFILVKLDKIQLHMKI